MSATLYREGDRLEDLLANLDAEYPAQVRVVSVTYPREGGVLGFFARQRVGVHYELDAGGDAAMERGGAAFGQATGSSLLDELIEQAETLERAQPVPADEPVPANLEFAQMLREFAAQKAAVRTASAVPAAPPAAAAPVVPAPAAPPMPAAPARVSRRTSDGALALRTRLGDVGVPPHLLPSGADTPARAAREVAAHIPQAPALPETTGCLVAVVGPAEHALAAAAAIGGPTLGADRLWVAGALPEHTPAACTVIRDRWAASTLADDYPDDATQPAIAVIATDGPEACDEQWTQRLLTALRPDAVWAVVDATRKTADLRRELKRAGTVDALAVVGAGRTCSPATVLELDIPVALLDGEPATARRWAAALLDSLEAAGS